MRVADVDAYGQHVNTYTATARTSAPAPTGPWAVYLANLAGEYRLLAFDLDAGARGDAAADAATLVDLLTTAGIPSVLLTSGPTGGHHVWVALTDALAATDTALLAQLLRQRLPTLDTTALSNPRTGCVRPPGAPHRRGGTSLVVRGDLGALTHPTSTAADVLVLLTHLTGAPNPDALQAATIPAPRHAPPSPTTRDEHGHLHLQRTRRPLPPAAAAALAAPVGEGDASAQLWRILVGAATAGWHHHDVATLRADAPGLEHLRTRRTAPGAHARQPRTDHASQTLLARHWDRAVRWSAANPTTTSASDPTFPERAAHTVDLVSHQQQRADAAAGRWTRRGGAAHRRVLDALCLLALQAAQPTIEADIRRLALLCGIGRESARTALLTLASEGWIQQTQAATGPRAAHWSLSTADAPLQRSQVPTRPPATLTLRAFLLDQLTTRLHAAAHDAFTATQAGGLGFTTGNLYAHLSDQPQDASTLARALGTTTPDVERRLTTLAQHHLARATTTGWRLPSQRRGDSRQRAARILGVTGHLTRRATRYRLEQAAWAWWQAELDWMTAPRRTGQQRRASATQGVLATALAGGAHPAHPRQRSGRADFAAARAALATGEAAA